MLFRVCRSPAESQPLPPEVEYYPGKIGCHCADQDEEDEPLLPGLLQSRCFIHQQQLNNKIVLVPGKNQLPCQVGKALPAIACPAQKGSMKLGVAADKMVLVTVCALVCYETQQVCRPMNIWW